MNELNSLLTCGYPWAQDRAQEALQISSAVHAGQMTKAEATELLQDLVNTDALDKLANDFATKTKLVNAINDLISVVESIPGM
jgi:polyhydroxyalkanoate synthesis regulator phasin